MKETKFKQTEVGMIPSDWEITSLQNAVVFLDSRRIPIKDSDRAKMVGRYPYYGASGIIDYVNDWIFDDDLILLGEDGANIVDRSSRLAFEIHGKCWVNNHAHVMKPNKDFCNVFLSEYLESLKYDQYNTGTAQPKLNREKCNGIPVIKPTIEEQQRIANALSDVDTLIANLEKLIAKKKNIKQGAMQQLLTGRKRLPGFGSDERTGSRPTDERRKACHSERSAKREVEESSGYKMTELGLIPSDWEVKTFGDVGKGFSAGATPYRQVDRYYEGDIKWVSSGELDYNVIQETQEHISIEAVKATNLTLHPKNTFLMAITGLEAAGTRGRCAILGCEATTNQSCLAIYESEYLFIPYLYHFYVKYGDALAFAYAQGSKQQSFTAAIVKKLPIILPSSKAEQTAIANVLSDMDTEISALETKLAKYRTLKTGMMQQLLTGKIRLI